MNLCESWQIKPVFSLPLCKTVASRLLTRFGCSRLGFLKNPGHNKPPIVEGNYMTKILYVGVFVLVLYSCMTNGNATGNENTLLVIIADTMGNVAAKLDWEDFNRRSKVENQLELSNLRYGADSLEIRIWCDFSFGNSQELYTLKLFDTNCMITFFRVYLRPINYDNRCWDREWNPDHDPIVDSAFSRTITISKSKVHYLNLDSVWLLKSQSELDISDSIGFTDCNTYILEIADRRRLRYLRYSCPVLYFQKTKVNEFLKYEDLFQRITLFAKDNGAYIE